MQTICAKTMRGGLLCTEASQVVVVQSSHRVLLVWCLVFEGMSSSSCVQGHSLFPYPSASCRCVAECCPTISVLYTWLSPTWPIMMATHAVFPPQLLSSRLSVQVEVSASRPRLRLERYQDHERSISLASDHHGHSSGLVGLRIFSADRRLDISGMSPRW